MRTAESEFSKLSRSPGIDSASVARDGILKLPRSPGIDPMESISPGYIAVYGRGDRQFFAIPICSFILKNLFLFPLSSAKLNGAFFNKK